MSRQLALLLVTAAAIVGSVLASAAGWLGDVIVCGADRTPGCAAWPMPVSAGLWLAFIVGLGALLIWQTRA